MGFANSPTIVRNGLVYCFDPGNPKSYPGSGTTVFELSKTRTSANGTLQNGATHTFNGGSYFSLDGTNDLIDVVDTYKTNFTSFTIDIWFRQEFNDQTRTLIEVVDQNDLNVIFNIFYLFSGTPNYQIILADLYNNPSSFDESFSLGNRQNLGWNNIIWSVNNIGGAFIESLNCINGVPTPPETIPGSYTYEYSFGGLNPSNIYIGYSDANVNFWQGGIGPVKLYNRALNRQEMLQNFNAHRGRYGV